MQNIACENMIVRPCVGRIQSKTFSQISDMVQSGELFRAEETAIPSSRQPLAQAAGAVKALFWIAMGIGAGLLLAQLS